MRMLFIEIAFKVSFLVAAAAATNALLSRRSSAASRHILWTLAVVGLLLLPLFSATLPTWEVTIQVAASKGADSATMSETTGQLQVTDVGGVNVDAGSPTAPNAAVATLPWSIASPGAWLTALPAVYALGVVLLFMRLAAQRWTVDRLARHATEASDPEWVQLLRDCASVMGVQRPVRLLRCRELIMPMAVGTRLPAILIPAVADMWSEDRRRAVLLHELAHIARHDCLTQMMAAVACALYWLHPGVWWIARRLRVERELACDDRVLTVGTRARDYAGHLLDLAYTLGGARAPALAVSMARPRQLEGRMLAVLDAARNRTAPALKSRASAAAAAVALLVPLAVVEATFVPVQTATTLIGDSTRAAATSNTVAEQRLPGTWQIRPSEAHSVHLQLNEADSSYGSTIPIERLEGLSPALLTGAGGAARFSIRHDAGTFTFEGTFRSGVGAGTYTFSPSGSFPAELAKKGFDRATPADQYALARSDIGFAFLDELTAQGYARPALLQLVAIGQHGVDLDYLREMGRLGYRLGRVEALVAQRDHGVSPQFIRELSAQGLAGLGADDLVRARDHGISPQYVSELRTLGYDRLTLEALVGARDHGISPEYVRGLRDLRYRFTLEELTQARDHGISPEYIRELTALGYQNLSFEALVGARDHGISPEYVRDLSQLGYRLTLDDLTKARDHGVSPEYIRDLAVLGYQRLSLDDLIRLRDHGVSPEYVRQLKGQGYNALTIDDLVNLRGRGDSWSDLISRAHLHVVHAIRDMFKAHR